MFQRKKIKEQKKDKVKFKDRKLNKSISLIIKNNNFSNIANNSILYQYIPKTSYSVQTSDRKPKKIQDKIYLIAIIYPNYIILIFLDKILKARFAL